MKQQLHIPYTKQEILIAFFDKDPGRIVNNKRFPRSNLRILLNEIYRNFYKEQTIYSGLISLFAGIDLMSTFVVEKNKYKHIAERFKAYLKDYCYLTKDESDLIWECRNAFVHSFSLYAYSLYTRKEYFFHPRFNEIENVIQIGKTNENGLIHVIIGIEPLYSKFFKSIDNAKSTCEKLDENDLRELYFKYGTELPLFEKENTLYYCDF